jgi:salicylate 5-hydroxylase large subunit
VIEYCQSATTAYPDGECVVELGGRDSGEATPHMVTETLIRGMYRYYRETLGL